MQLTPNKPRRSFWQRICALALCAVMLLGLVPDFHPEASAASWADPYLDQLVAWDVMRGDENGLSPDRPITRAEFAAMLNRAFGYTKTASHPFRDVLTSDWYNDDIGIAYAAGYFTGTSNNTAAPRSTLSREAAATLICRNLMVQPASGEDLSFTDSRTASSWSRGYIKAASDSGMLTGYEDGSFRPKDNIKRSEVAAILSRVIGTPIQDPGTYSDSVSGNLTVTTSGVTLENMTVTGDLFISPGVGLGYVTLNNVKVLGKIIASGAGESNKGDSSIILKNTTAPEMIIDSPSNQFVSVRANGSTKIDKTYVRTPTYLEDKSRSKYGLEYIEIDGEEGTRLDLAGNIKEVVAKTPRSVITVGNGTVDKMTIDEQAPNSTVTIDEGAVVEEMNLDTATTVNGKGDIGTLHVNAAGCRVEMLPDEIIIRPGITATINGQVMTSADAERASQIPRILSGYPRLQDIAPTQATSEYRTNKPGTLYWAVRLSGDGPLTADELITPPSYGAKIVKNGNLSVKTANTIVSQNISGLKLDTSYILSVVLRDSRGDNSAVKNVYFTTPDNSKPNFASGYPKASKVEDTYVDFDVAATKNCTLYWAVFKKGMSAPTANDFKDNVLSGAIDSGSQKMIRSEEETIGMGDNPEITKQLVELGEYDAYFFLTDTVNDSAIKKISFTTADRTPPEFRDNYPRISKVAAKALTTEATTNENCTVYWAVVRHGTEYPMKKDGLDAAASKLDQQLQVKAGMYALKSGSGRATKDKALTLNISGLDVETAYDIYYVAEDAAGNMSDIKKLEGKTLDNTPPTVINPLTFTQPDADGNPMAGTDVIMTFSEDVYDTTYDKSLVEIWTAANGDSSATETQDARQQWYNILMNNFELWNLTASPRERVELEEYITEDNAHLRVTAELDEEGRTVVTFTTNALHLSSGTRYQFILNNFRDSSNNLMGKNYNKIDPFTTVYAQVHLDRLGETNGIVKDKDGNSLDVEFDMSFVVDPVKETITQMAESVKYDLVFASDTSVAFDLYARKDSTSDWTLIEPDVPIQYTPSNGDWLALTLNRINNLAQKDYPIVRDLEYTEYAIHFTRVGGSTERNTWDATINMTLMCLAGDAGNLNNLNGAAFVKSKLDDALKAGEVIAISTPNELILRKILTNTDAPEFRSGYPLILPGDSIANINVVLDRLGTIHYVVARYGTAEKIKGDDGKDQIVVKEDSPALPPRNADGLIKWDNIPPAAASNDVPDKQRQEALKLVTPNAETILSKSFDRNENIIQDEFLYSGSGGAQTISVQGLQPNTAYVIYFVLQGSSISPSIVYCYKFVTGEVDPPALSVEPNGDTANIEVTPLDKDSSVEATVYWRLYASNDYPSILRTEEYTDPNGKKDTLLNALLDIHSTFNSDQSVAATNLKEDLWRILTSNTNANPFAVQSGQFNTKKATSSSPHIENVIDPENLEIGTRYLLIVGAQNSLGGPYVFTATSNIQRVNTAGPLVRSMTTTSQPTDKDKGLYTAQVTIRFTDPLYLSQDDPDGGFPILHPIWAGGTGSGYPSKKDYAVFLAGILSLNSVTGWTPVVVEISKQSPIEVMQITFRGLQIGDSFTFGPPRTLEGEDVSNFYPALLANAAGITRKSNPTFYLIQNPDFPDRVSFSLDTKQLVQSEVD